MTHDELLELIGNYQGYAPVDYGQVDLVNALRAVVELHKPEYWQNPNVAEWNGARCTHCLEEQGDYMSPIPVDYPCPTIQAIEKELE